LRRVVLEFRGIAQLNGPPAPMERWIGRFAMAARIPFHLGTTRHLEAVAWVLTSIDLIDPVLPENAEGRTMGRRVGG
jgi:hypothetical protein